MTSYKELVQAKQNYEYHLADVNKQIQKMKEEGKSSSSKMQKHLKYKSELEAQIQAIATHLERINRQYQEQQNNAAATMPQGWNPLTKTVDNPPGEGRRNAGKALIVFGIFIVVISFIVGSWQGGVLGFIINIIGIILYVSGNRAQGRGTTVIGGGGFVSSG